MKTVNRSYLETYFELSALIYRDISKEVLPELLKQEHTKHGYCVFYTLAERWADEFEELNKNRQWDGEFIEEIEIFYNNKINNYGNSY